MPLETALEGKPVYWGLGIGLVLAALCVAGTQYMWINDLNLSIARTNADLDDLQKKIENGRAAEKKLPQFREEVARLELELEKLRRILPSSKNTEEIIKKIKSLVDQGDFGLRSMTFPKLKTAGEGGEPFVDWPIQIVVEGSYHNLAILFNRLSNFSRIMNVEQFDITALASQVERTVTANFVAKTFVYVEPKEPEPDKTKKGKPGGAAAKEGGE